MSITYPAIYNIVAPAIAVAIAMLWRRHKTIRAKKVERDMKMIVAVFCLQVSVLFLQAEYFPTFNAAYTVVALAAGTTLVAVGYEIWVKPRRRE